MQDVGNHYDEVGHIGQGPYFNMQNLDPRLSNILDRDRANIHLGGADGISPTEAYGEQMGSEVLTPSKSKSATRAKKGKKAQIAEAEDPDPEVPCEEDDEEEGDDFESEDEDQEDYEEPVVRKKHRPATKLKLSTPKSHKGTPKSSARSSKTARRSGGTKTKDALPFNRQRRAPKNGITDSRPIPRSYDECDEADKALLDMRDKEKKTWKEIRAMWEELTGQKTGTSTLPNRYE